MKKYIALILDICNIDQCKARVYGIYDSRDEAVKTIVAHAASYNNFMAGKDLYPDVRAECRKEVSGDFDYSILLIAPRREICGVKFKIVEVEL